MKAEVMAGGTSLVTDKDKHAGYPKVSLEALLRQHMPSVFPRPRDYLPPDISLNAMISVMAAINWPFHETKW